MRISCQVANILLKQATSPSVSLRRFKSEDSGSREYRRALHHAGLIFASVQPDTTILLHHKHRCRGATHVANSISAGNPWHSSSRWAHRAHSPHAISRQQGRACICARKPPRLPPRTNRSRAAPAQGDISGQSLPCRIQPEYVNRDEG